MLHTIDLDFETEEAVYEYAKSLVGMTFNDVLELEIVPRDGKPRKFSARSKGHYGTLLEERYFGYKANSNPDPDFPKAGVELKATCIDSTKNGDVAGERLSLTMIPYDRELPEDLYDSHLWHKCRRILLVWYIRDKTLERPYDQVIVHVGLFTPPEEDLKVIEADYRLITDLVREGRAEELSEGLTAYLSAATKGASAEKSIRPQRFYAPEKVAKRRAFAYKKPYMNYVLQHYIMGEPEPEYDSVVHDPRSLQRQTLIQYVAKTIGSYAGMTDRQLADALGIPFTGNKAQWTTIAYRILDVRGSNAAEFAKAGIHVRTLRTEPGMASTKESMPLIDIDFLSLASETDWEESELRCYLEDLVNIVVVFEKSSKEKGADCVLRGAFVMAITDEMLDGKIRTCWERAVECVRRGVDIYPEYRRDGTFWRWRNDLPAESDDLYVHVRPRTDHAAYLFEDGTTVGDVKHDARPLPDGRWMTKQAFWLNKSYVLAIARRELMG